MKIEFYPGAYRDISQFVYSNNLMQEVERAVMQPFDDFVQQHGNLGESIDVVLTGIFCGIENLDVVWKIDEKGFVITRESKT